MHKQIRFCYHLSYSSCSRNTHFCLFVCFKGDRTKSAACYFTEKTTALSWGLWSTYSLCYNCYKLFCQPFFNSLFPSFSGWQILYQLVTTISCNNMFHIVKWTPSFLYRKYSTIASCTGYPSVQTIKQTKGYLHLSAKTPNLTNISATSSTVKNV